MSTTRQVAQVLASTDVATRNFQLAAQHAEDIGATFFRDLTQRELA